ncbi:hypothetical protein DID77_03655 [Candidatus Marinamargulisbacteria bacterium SCGC AG-439-L15]|nr:hypothetical protein DID77_03655 [Candidatus Marinamargulisbacteria bacterium SCGC AG-439-L15]
MGVIMVILLASLSTPISKGPLHLQQLRQTLQQYSDTQNTTVSLVYMSTNSSESVALNPRLSVNPASVIKVPILIEAYRQLEMGRLKKGQLFEMKKEHLQKGAGRLKYHALGTRYTIHDLLYHMIVNSDNTATKMLIAILGQSRINEGIKRLGLRDTYLHTDNLLTGQPKNKASAYDMALLLHKLYRGEVISKGASDEIVRLLSKQKYRWGIPQQLPKKLRVANKTGSLRWVSHDVGIVFFPDAPYILSIFVSDIKTTLQARKQVAKLSQIVYQWQKKQKPFIMKSSF